MTTGRPPADIRESLFFPLPSVTPHLSSASLFFYPPFATLQHIHSAFPWPPWDVPHATVQRRRNSHTVHSII